VWPENDLVDIAGGRVLVGADSFYREESPPHEVEVQPFRIQRGPVTVAEFERFTSETGYVTLAEREPDAFEYPEADSTLLAAGSAVFQPAAGPVPLDNTARWWRFVPGASWRNPWGPGTDNDGRHDHPVTHIALEDAEAYARWSGMALPSEAEWECAARGGIHGATFAWGDEEHPGGALMANYWQGEFPWRNAGAKGWRGTSPVGLFPPNGFGLFDVTGNVWEWTCDDYAEGHVLSSYVARACCVAPVEPATQDEAARRWAGAVTPKAIKGGSHLCAPSYCFRYRPAARQPALPDTSTSHIGFRCVVRAAS
jgi:sulfatase modifying factor 1